MQNVYGFSVLFAPGDIVYPIKVMADSPSAATRIAREAVRDLLSQPKLTGFRHIHTGEARQIRPATQP